jgi:copper transport protein
MMSTILHEMAWQARRRHIGRFLGLLALQFAAATAFAHASLISTEPSDGAMLHSAPDAVTLHFNEAVAPLVFKLLLPDGSVNKLTPAAAVSDGLRLTLPPLSAQGTYLLSWRVVSADGHPVGGALTYSVGACGGKQAGANATMGELNAATPPSQIAAIWLTRLGLYLALFIGVGGALFRAFVAGRPENPGESAEPARWVAAFATLGMLLLPLAVGLQGLDALALPWSALLTWAPWQASLTTAYGTTAGLMLMTLTTALMFIVGARHLGRVVPVTALLLLGAAFAASGHASAAMPQWLARPAVFIHGVSIAMWVGSLLPLMILLKGRQSGPDRVIASLLRFSRFIPWVLLLLLVSGIILALLQLSGWSSLWTTDYGRILSAKLILVAVLLAVAAVNRYTLTSGVLKGETDARLWMKRLIVAELALVILVLALATTWRFTPPPRALRLSQAAPVSMHLHGEKAMTDMTLEPQPDHRLRAVIFVQTADFSPLNAQEVAVQFSNPALGIEPLQKDAHRAIDGGSGGSSGNWLIDPFALPAPGRWHVRIDVLISDFENTTLEQDVDIAF